MFTCDLHVLLGSIPSYFLLIYLHDIWFWSNTNPRSNNDVFNTQVKAFFLKLWESIKTSNKCSMQQFYVIEMNQTFIMPLL